MEKILFLFLIFYPIHLDAQNVGIGNPSPAEKLDVNGNINVTGTIKANGTDGTAGQVLMKNSSGVFNWGDLGDFKNVAAFTDTTTLNISWNVPANTNRIWVELWGGGGAGFGDAALRGAASAGAFAGGDRVVGRGGRDADCGGCGV